MLKLRVGTSCKQTTYCRAKRDIKLYVKEILWLSHGWEAGGFRLSALQTNILFLLFTIQQGGCSEGVGMIAEGEFVPWIIV